MKQNVLLVITSLLSIFFMTVHLTDDIIRGMEKVGPSNLVAVPILVAWLYGTLVLASDPGHALGVFFQNIYFG